MTPTLEDGFDWDKEYPEHKKLHKIQERSQFIGEFLDFARHNGMELYEYVEEVDELMINLRPGKRLVLVKVRKSIRQLLAEMFGIDIIKLEDEKQLIYQRFQKMQQEQQQRVEQSS